MLIVEKGEEDNTETLFEFKVEKEPEVPAESIQPDEPQL